MRPFPISHIEPMGPNGLPERRFAAAHEAAHAVVARAFGISGGGAWIRVTANGVVGGATSAHRSCLPYIWKRVGKYRRPASPILAKIIIAAAGAEAELYLYGWCRWDDRDREAVYQLLTLLPEGLRREDRLRAFARQLVRRHYIAISFAAGSLAEKLELTGAEIDAWMPAAWIARHGVITPPCTGNPNRCAKCLI
jgi:hypothetical protein